MSNKKIVSQLAEKFKIKRTSSDKVKDFKLCNYLANLF